MGKSGKRFWSILVCAALLMGLMQSMAFAGGVTVDFAIAEHWGVYFEQTGSNKKYPILLNGENKLSVPIPTLYRTDYVNYVFDGWYIADTDTKVTQDTVFDDYTVVVDRWIYQEKDASTLVKHITINNVDLVAGMTVADYNAAALGAVATENGITADSATTYTIYHGLNKFGDPLDPEEEIEVGQDYSVVTRVKLEDGFTFDPNITFSSDAGMCASERFLGGADLYTKEWNTLANAVEVTINFMNTQYYFAQTPESRMLENYAQYRNWYKVSKHEGLESVTLQYEVGNDVWAVFLDNVPFEAVGQEAGGYVTVSPYADTAKTFRLVANYTQGKVYSEPFTVTWACLNPVIEEVHVGITAPQEGYSPEYTITRDSNRYVLKAENDSFVQNGIKWTGNTAGDLAVSGSKFNNDNDYIVSIKLVAQEGYTFANDVTATINAQTADIRNATDREIRITYTFPKPEKAKYYVSFNNPGGYATGTMASVLVEEGEYTLPDPAYTPVTGYVFDGWQVKGELKQPGDVIDVTEALIIEAKWRNTIDYDAPHGFTKQPPSKSTNAFGETAVAGIGFIPYSFADDLTIDPSIDYEYISVEFYDAESGEWVASLDKVFANYNAFTPETIQFNSSKAGVFTCRICAKKTVGGNVAISESFTVTWVPKQFTTQPQGGVAEAGETVTVTAVANAYVTRYEIEYQDNGVWKLYQEEVEGGWDDFRYDFTSGTAKSVTFRVKAYTEGDEYDEEKECFPEVLMDTSEEFTIIWTSQLTFGWEGNVCTVTLEDAETGNFVLAAGYQGGKLVGCAFLDTQQMKASFTCDEVKVFRMGKTAYAPICDPIPSAKP